MMIRDIGLLFGPRCIT